MTGVYIYRIELFTDLNRIEYRRKTKELLHCFVFFQDLSRGLVSQPVVVESCGSRVKWLDQTLKRLQH